MFLTYVTIPDVPLYTVHQHLWAHYPPLPEKSERPFVFRFFGNNKALMLSALKPLSPNLEISEKLQNKQTYTFDALLNPTERKAGKIQAVISNTARQAWVKRLLSGADVRFVQVFDRERVNFMRGDGERVTFTPARFTGVLQITDRDLFEQTLLRGVGRAKAWGCGMIYLPEVMDAVINGHG